MRKKNGRNLADQKNENKKHKQTKSKKNNKKKTKKQTKKKNGTLRNLRGTLRNQPLCFFPLSGTLRNLRGTFAEPCGTTHYVFSLWAEPSRNPAEPSRREILKKTIAEPCGTFAEPGEPSQNPQGTLGKSKGDS